MLLMESRFFAALHSRGLSAAEDRDARRFGKTLSSTKILNPHSDGPIVSIADAENQLTASTSSLRQEFRREGDAIAERRAL
ncbi:hypothetical protein [Teichococcus wenyumeiae]|uniref:hypothetical protein n=1 Tax=Teichococcus wenyumeiae TaxID=2478470 RepID=UPI0011C3CA62|nr:hypothetical protein [Pseudoroseomonas wenyumeiae]